MTCTTFTTHAERASHLPQVLLGLSKEALSMSLKKPQHGKVSSAKSNQEATKEAAVAKEQAAAQEVSCSNNLVLTIHDHQNDE